MKNGRQNSEGFVGHSLVFYGPSLIFGGSNQFSPDDFVDQNWGEENGSCMFFFV